MTIDYLYCGECKEVIYEEHFLQCCSCSEPYEHPSGHGYYCDTCLPTNMIKEGKDDDGNDDICCLTCFNKYFKIVKCSICKKEQMKEELRDCDGCSEKLNYKKFKKYFCQECDSKFMCQKCDEGLYFCNKECSDEHREYLKQEQKKEEKDKKKQQLEEEKILKELEDAKKIARKEEKILNDLEEAEQILRREVLKKKAIKFDESKWASTSELCAECNIFPCECAGV